MASDHVKEKSSAPRPDRSRQGGKLRTYVTANGTEKNPDRAENRPEQWSAVDKAGVSRVLEYEQREGRFPEEKPPNHPGYDVESRDSTGKVVRYIEVKSLSWNWGSLGAALTRPQFEKASELGERYWLYVVERAERDDFRIHPIQNPARQVNQFIYDNGWKVLSEGMENE